MDNPIFVNSDDRDYHDYIFIIQGHLMHDFIVYADNLQDAIDAWIDYLDESGDHPGYFMDTPENEEYLDEYIMGGNYGKYLTFGWHEIITHKLRMPTASDYNAWILAYIKTESIK